MIEPKTVVGRMILEVIKAVEDSAFSDPGAPKHPYFSFEGELRPEKETLWRKFEYRDIHLVSNSYIRYKITINGGPVVYYAPSNEGFYV
jgi:hypothetical protein